jgi:F-type H+-transporting ATPase subunit a
MRAMTGDLNTTLGWALVTTVMVWVVSIRKNGFLGWLKSFIEPVPFILPLNLVSEISNPISMAFRHFGNIASGIVISGLIYQALAGLSSMILGPGAIPIFQVGIPAFLSLYFDIWTGFLQAYIISMLTMVFVSLANE